VQNTSKKLFGGPNGTDDLSQFQTNDDGSSNVMGFRDDTQTVLFEPDSARIVASAPAAAPGGTGTVTSAATTSPFVINITFDASAQSAPTGFMAGILAAAQYLESQFTDAVTLNIAVGYGEVNGSALGANALGSSQTFLTSVSYATLLNALKLDAKTATDTSVIASLPATSPVAGTFWATTGEAKALGLLPGTQASTDGFTGFSSSLAFDFNNADGVTAGTFDFNGVVLHEFSEVMGRMLLTGATIGTTTNSYDTYDLLHYASPGLRDFLASTPGYFSVNGGTTNLGGFNTVAGGDAGDWGSAMGNDSFNAFSASGVVNAVSSSDLTALDAIGWDRGTGTSGSQPTGVAISPATQALAGAQSTSGLTAGVALATATQIGGAAGDSYSYTLGGAGAASFALSTTGNVGTLAAGAAGVAATTNGRVYALTLSATDLNSGLSSPPAALNVIVASSGADTVSVAALVGSGAIATPAFIYGLAGNDQLNATGMTSKLWFAGGAGADTMTGGSGVNDYLYGATSDSTAAATDMITNFRTATDLVDLTGLGVALQFSGKLTASSIAAHSIGWQVSQGNTFAYVNTSVGTETLTAANMAIEFRGGSVPLTSSNFLHV
jgi:hypothetical protein